MKLNLQQFGGRGSSNPNGGGSGGVGGSGLSHTADLEHSADLQKKLNKEEARTRNHKREQMTVYDRNGEEVMHKQGGKGSVTYSVREAQENFYGATITHNHPAGDERGGVSGTFSVADVETFRYGLKEMRASGAEGTYVLRNKNYNSRTDDQSWKFWQSYSEFTEKQNFSGIDVIKKAQAKAGKSKIGRQYSREMAKATKLYNSGNRDSALRIYDGVKKNIEPAYRREVKRHIYENMNSKTSGWLKQNAPKYGFEYILTT